MQLLNFNVIVSTHTGHVSDSLVVSALLVKKRIKWLLLKRVAR